MKKTDVRAAIEVSPGTNAMLSYSLRGCQPVLRHLWENHVPWIIRKFVDFIGAIDDYLDEFESTPPGDR